MGEFQRTKIFLCKAPKKACELAVHFLMFAAPLAQVAELVDALVSNTSWITPVPVRPRSWAQKKPLEFSRGFFFGTSVYLTNQTNFDSISGKGALSEAITCPPFTICV